jgi:hypothetical protein
MSADDSLPNDVTTLKAMLIAAQAACLEAQGEGAQRRGVKKYKEGSGDRRYYAAIASVQSF